MNKFFDVDKKFISKWHIYQIDGWEEDDINLLGGSYIEITRTGIGKLRFGLVNANIDGTSIYQRKDRFEFAWQGKEEDIDVSGWGWCRVNGKNELEGYIKTFLEEDNKFIARK